jgi:hypothetical protein
LPLPPDEGRFRLSDDDAPTAGDDGSAAAEELDPAGDGACAGVSSMGCVAEVVGVASTGAEPAEPPVPGLDESAGLDELSTRLGGA